MSRTAIAAVILAALAAPAQAQAPAPPASPAPEAAAVQFPSEVELVTVDVVVTDKKGNPVTGLTASDFQLLEEGVPQSIASFEAIELPATVSTAPAPPRPRVSNNQLPEVRGGRSFVIVYDDIHLSPFHAHRAKTAVAEFLKSGVREGDRVTLVATGGGAWWSTRMLAGRQELIDMLKRLDGRHIPDRSPDRMSDYEAMRIHVYRDQQVEERVSRRFETYGASSRAGRSESEQFMDGDPLVRGRAAEIYFQSVARNRITLQVLERVLTSLAGTRGRKSVILVSEGFIFDPNLDEFKKVVTASRRSNAAMYFVDTRGLSGMPTFASAEFGPPLDNRDIGFAFMDSLQEAEGAESLAADSGGFSVKNTNDLAKGIGRIASETRAYYLLGYNPKDVKRDGRFRKIDVKVPGRKGIQVRARRGYFAPLDGAAQADAAKGVDPDIQAALDSPFDEKQIPIRMTAWVFDETLLGKASTIVGALVDVSGFAFEEKDGRFVDTLEFLMVVAHRESGEFFRYDQKVDMRLLPATKEKVFREGMPIVRDFELAPGGYQAKLVVRDANSRRIGTVVHEFEVAPLDGLRVSTPLLSDTLHRGEDGKGTPRVPPDVDRTVPADGTLYASFEVYGAARDKATGMPNVTAGYVVRRVGEEMPVINVAPTRITPTSLGKLSRIVGSALGGAPPGEYELVLTVNDVIAGKTVEVREPLTVVGAAAAGG